MRALLGCVPGRWFFRFHPFKYILPLLSGLQLLRNQRTVLQELPCTQRAAFNAPPLTSPRLATACLAIFLFGLILFGTACASWTWMSVFFSKLGSFQLLCLHLCSLPLSLPLSSLWDPYHVNVYTLDVIPVFSYSIFVSFYSFLFLLFHLSDFYHCLPSLLFCSSISSNPMLIPSRAFSISVTSVFICLVLYIF